MGRDLHLGAVIDEATRARGAALSYDADHLDTHAVIVGMTGSGKTGLGVVLLEELLRAGVPALVIDPKGDMGNLALTFPLLSESEFEPWVESDGGDRAQVARDTAATWRDGLASWGLGATDVAALRGAAPVTVYTPGSTSGRPLNVLGSFTAPDIDWNVGAEDARAEIEGLVSGLLALIDIDAEPLTSREHILLANLVERAWREGAALDLAQLIGHIQAPPMRKLGVFELDTFFPPRERQALALKLNGLLASPSFAAWMEGDAVDIGRLLWSADGQPRASVVYLAHLSQSERQFVVTLLLSKLATWMQSQPGSSRLRAAVYMDEVFGFVPPTSAPPSKKPILTLLKQARAFGIGVILSTQNPVDLDYKAMSNAGTWMIGRLQTERDKARILEALASARGGVDVRALDQLVSDLGKREFLLHDARASEPRLFTTRWAMSYLAGPMPRAQLGRLEVSAPAAPASPQPARTAAPATPAAALDVEDDESPLMPAVADGVPVVYLDPAAPWAPQVGARPDGTRYRAGLAARVRLVFDERKADLDHTQEWEAIFPDLGPRFDPSTAVVVDHDPRDFRRQPAGAATYVVPEAPIDGASFFRSAEKDLRDWLNANQELRLWHNPELRLYSMVGESREAFRARCDRAADDLADAEAAKLRDKLETRLRAIQKKIDAAERREDEARAQLSDSKTDEVVSGVGSVLGVLLGRRSSRSIARGASTSARRATRNRQRSARLARKADGYGDQADDLRDELEELEAEVTDDITAIHTGWAAKAAAIEETTVGLERNDISVTELALVWLPE